MAEELKTHVTRLRRGDELLYELDERGAKKPVRRSAVLHLLEKGRGGA